MNNEHIPTVADEINAASAVNAIERQISDARTNKDSVALAKWAHNMKAGEGDETYNYHYSMALLENPNLPSGIAEDLSDFWDKKLKSGFSV